MANLDPFSMESANRLNLATKSFLGYDFSMSLSAFISLTLLAVEMFKPQRCMKNAEIFVTI
jgi:hypothetical protein